MGMPAYTQDSAERIKVLELLCRDLEVRLKDALAKVAALENENNDISVVNLKLLDEIRELAVLNSNQQSMLEGKHKYVGQDFHFRLDKQAARIASLEADHAYAIRMYDAKETACLRALEDLAAITRVAEQYQAEALALRADAERYRRLGVLIQAGAWGVCIAESNEDDQIWMDDKAHMDRLLDGAWAKEAAQWLAAMQMARKEGNNG